MQINIYAFMLIPAITAFICVWQGTGWPRSQWIRWLSYRALALAVWWFLAVGITAQNASRESTPPDFSGGLGDSSGSLRLMPDGDDRSVWEVRVRTYRSVSGGWFGFTRYRRSQWMDAGCGVEGIARNLPYQPGPEDRRRILEVLNDALAEREMAPPGALSDLRGPRPARLSLPEDERRFSLDLVHADWAEFTRTIWLGVFTNALTGVVVAVDLGLAVRRWARRRRDGRLASASA